MKRLIVLVAAATLMLSACGSGTGDEESTSAAETPSASATPTAGALPTPTPTHATPPPLPEEALADEPVTDLEPERITAIESALLVWNDADQVIDVIPYNIAPVDAVAEFTDLFGVTPTRVSHPTVPAGSPIVLEWQSGDYDLDGWDFGGLQMFPRYQVYDLRWWEIRVTAQQVHGIDVEFEDGTHVGTPTSAITTKYGEPWADADQYFYGTFASTRGYLFFRSPGGSTVAGWLIPYGP